MSVVNPIASIWNIDVEVSIEQEEKTLQKSREHKGKW